MEMIGKTSHYCWYQGDLHTHTVHSDGKHTIYEAVDIAKKQGLDFIALTDHNTFSQNRSLPSFEDFVIIPGVELTTAQGHVNFLGSETPIKIFEYESVEEVAAMTKEACEAEAYISINHPFIGDRWRWGFDNVTYHGVELWNGTPLSRNEEIIEWWQEQLSQGKRIYITGGSDVHEHGTSNRWYGEGRTYIYAARLNADALVEALKQGHNGVGASGAASFCTFNINEAMMGDTVKVSSESLVICADVGGSNDRVIRIYGSKGQVLEKPIPAGASSYYEFVVKDSSCFYRLEVWQQRDDGALEHPFFTNPIYVEKMLVI